MSSSNHAVPPLVSIGLPVLNGEKYLSDTLDAILRQTYGGFELLISNNHSNDKTADICVEYARRDARIRVVRPPRRLAACENFKFALLNARGSLFTWMAADDWWSPDWLDTLLHQRSEENISTFGSFCYTDSKGKILGPPIRPPDFRKGDYAKVFMNSEKSGKCFYIYGLYDRQKLLCIRAQEGTQFLGLDQVMLLECLQFGNLKSVDGPVYYYRLHDESVSQQEHKEKGGRRRALVSRFPALYYRKALDFTPWPSKAVVLLLLPAKYLREQIPCWIHFFQAYLLSRYKKMVF